MAKRLRNITELAALAGVSPGTVSRALAGKSIVNAKTRERIQELAREHGFRLNQMASKLRTQQTKVIGVAIPLGHERNQSLSDPFFMSILGHLADGLSNHGYDLMLSRVIPKEPDWLDRIVMSGMVDGMLLIGQSDQFHIIEEVAEYYRPLVAWGVYREGQRHCAVGTDNKLGGKLAAERLLSQGRRKLVYLGDINAPEFSARYHGANEVIATAGLPSLQDYPISLLPKSTPSEVAAQFEGFPDDVDGIIAASDVIAAKAVHWLAGHGRRVPEDVAIIGYDDLPVAGYMVPGLTTVRQDIAQGAKAMISALFDRMRGDDGLCHVMPPELIVRDSG